MLTNPEKFRFSVLVTSDDSYTQELFKEALSAAYFSVDFAINDADCLRMVKQKNYDVCYLTVKKTPIQRISAFEKLQKEAFPGYIVVMSNDMSIEMAVNYVRKGAYDILKEANAALICGATETMIVRKYGDDAVAQLRYVNLPQSQIAHIEEAFKSIKNGFWEIKNEYLSLSKKRTDYLEGIDSPELKERKQREKTESRAELMQNIEKGLIIDVCRVLLETIDITKGERVSVLFAILNEIDKLVFLSRLEIHYRSILSYQRIEQSLKNYLEGYW